MHEKHRQAVVAIIRKGDRFLLIKRSDYIETAKGYWTPVSGGIEEGETQKETIAREVMEEVGIEVEAGSFVCAIPSNDGNSFLHYWTTKIIGGEARVASHEATDLRWVTIEEMKQLNPVFEEDIRIFENLETERSEQERL